METSHERQYNLDLLKAFAIICMVICHVVITLGAYRPDHQNELNIKEDTPAMPAGAGMGGMM